MVKHIVIPVHKKGDKKRWKTIEELAYLMHVINYKRKSESTSRTVLACQNELQIDRSYINPLCCMKFLIEKRRQFKLGSHLALVAYVKAF
jgi:hypothetical protein